MLALAFCSVNRVVLSGADGIFPWVGRWAGRGQCWIGAAVRASMTRRPTCWSTNSATTQLPCASVWATWTSESPSSFPARIEPAGMGTDHWAVQASRSAAATAWTGLQMQSSDVACLCPAPAPPSAGTGGSSGAVQRAAPPRTPATEQRLAGAQVQPGCGGCGAAGGGGGSALLRAPLRGLHPPGGSVPRRPSPHRRRPLTRQACPIPHPHARRPRSSDLSDRYSVGSRMLMCRSSCWVSRGWLAWTQLFLCPRPDATAKTSFLPQQTGYVRQVKGGVGMRRWSGFQPGQGAVVQAAQQRQHHGRGPRGCCGCGGAGGCCGAVRALPGGGRRRTGSRGPLVPPAAGAPRREKAARLCLACTPPDGAVSRLLATGWGWQRCHILLHALRLVTYVAFSNFTNPSSPRNCPWMHVPEDSTLSLGRFLSPII